MKYMLKMDKFIIECFIADYNWSFALPGRKQSGEIGDKGAEDGKTSSIFPLKPHRLSNFPFSRKQEGLTHGEPFDLMLEDSFAGFYHHFFFLICLVIIVLPLLSLQV